LVFLACLLPTAILMAELFGYGGGLGANPIEEIQDRFGNWTLRMLVITLAITPMRHLTGRPWVLRFRRMFGLFAFFYALMHFLTWLVLDQDMNQQAIVEDISERPFITIGFAAFLILTALAITSTNRMRRRLGKRWQQLHYGVYAATVLGVWHFWWQVKQDLTEPLIYAIMFMLLLGFRAYKYKNPKKSPSRANRD
jgi:sulfoxide reductase heme-binding subunit YedZ